MYSNKTLQKQAAGWIWLIDHSLSTPALKYFSRKPMLSLHNLSKCGTHKDMNSHIHGRLCMTGQSWI